MGVRLNYNLDISDRSTWLTVTSRPQVRASFPYVQELGDFHCGPEYYTSRENLASYLIKYTVSGEGTLNYGGSTWRIQPGTAFWIDCMQPQYYRTAPGAGGWHMLWVHLYGPTVQAYYEAFRDQNGDSPIVQAGPGAGFANPLEALLDIYRTGGSSLQDDIQASMLLTQLMVSCIHRAGQLDSLYRVPRFIMDIRDFINANYREDISLDSLAHNYSINKFYLQKLFKRHTGVSPNEYLTLTRLAHAKHLLRTTNAPILQVAEEVGYAATYFNTVFRKYEGVTPRTYRQKWYVSGEAPEPPQ